jgi:6-phosphofructokinase 1
MNLAHRLAMLITERLRIRARSEKPGLLGRSNSLCISPVDWTEARECGRAAVEAAVKGSGGNMITLIRGSDLPYHAKTGLVLLERVAFLERTFPANWRNQTENDVTSEFISYITPLVGPIAHYEGLQDRPVLKRWDCGGGTTPH